MSWHYITLLLIVERRRGDASPLKPYLDAAPASFHTPLFYTRDEMEGLRGTNLYAAVMQQHRQLCAVLERHVQPAAKKLFAALKAAPPPPLTEEEVAAGAGQKRGKKGSWFGSGGGGGERVKGGAVTMEEFQWAYAAFWSRALSLPIGTDPIAPVVEGIIPGIDFANHSGKAPNARWAIAGLSGVASKDEGGEPRVELLCEPGSLPAPGAELFISYGDKPNEVGFFLVDP